MTHSFYQAMANGSANGSIELAEISLASSMPGHRNKFRLPPEKYGKQDVLYHWLVWEQILILDLVISDLEIYCSDTFDNFVRVVV